MIARIIELSVRNRFLVLVTAAALAAFGVYAMLDTPVDAVPDLGENQVIVFTDWPGRSPREIEDQVSYPLSRKLQGLAGVRVVRSSSEFNFSMITVIFEDNVDFYFARQRVSERLAEANNYLPKGVTPYLAPDATALGQIFWYTVEPDPKHPVDPPRLWALNKFYIAPQLTGASGVAEVAPVGGMPQEYQVDVRPEDLRAYGVTIGELFEAVSRSNLPAAGGVIQKNNAEYIVRGIGWIRDKADIENALVREVNGVPVYVKTVATVQLGTGFRRGVFEKNGNEVVGGVVLMRHGGNPLRVTEAVKAKIEELKPGLPEGVRIVPAYDRTRLITGAIGTLRTVMWHEMAIAAVAILLILTHVRSAFVICITLPLSVLFSFALMWLLRKAGIVDIQANIMSLAGITISVGVLVDQAIVMVENATHHLKEKFGRDRVTGDTRELLLPALRMVGRPIFFSVMIMLLSFVPVFLLSGHSGKLFHPLAYTKSFALLGTALISVTVVPALIPSFIRGRLKGEDENWIVRSFTRIYRPMLNFALDRFNLVMWSFAVLLILAAGLFPLQALFGFGSELFWWKRFFAGACVLVGFITVVFTRGIVWQLLSFVSLVALALWAWHFPKIGVDYVPKLDEGTTLDMPVTVPRVGVTQASDDLKARNALIRGFPEVESVVGKVGRAETATDPAPLDMVETFVNFRPRDLWPRRVLRYSDAVVQTRRVIKALERRGYLAAADDRDGFVNDVTQKALERFDEVMRELALRRYQEIEKELGSTAGADDGRLQQWHERVKALNWELFDRGTEAFTWFAMEETAKAARGQDLLDHAPRGEELERFAAQAVRVVLDKPYESDVFPIFGDLRAELEKAFRDRVIFRVRTGGPKGDLVDDEMGRVLQVPGWSNIFTQPIVNRIEMLSSGVRTDIGIKVFGPDLDTVMRVCQQIEAAVKPVNGARDVVAAPIMGKGYLEIAIDREKAARFGVSVEDVQTEIETALGGRVVTFTVENRERFPVRVRYARVQREDEEAVKRLLVPAGLAGNKRDPAMTGDPTFRTEAHGAVAEHSAKGRRFIPLTAVASVRITEGPAVIKSENGQLLNYVTLNVRGRDSVGFVEEAKRVVAETVKLPEGVHVEWAGEFQHQERAANTLRWVFPAVILVIFLVLYLTYNDLADAGLMMLAVPEALAGGAFFLYFFPKVLDGWDAPPVDFSVAVWVGFIACFGMATETGIIMLVYLREAIDKRGGLEAIGSLEELRAAVVEGAVHRLRPKLLTEGVAIIAIFPMVFASGVGGEILAPMALPVLGGLLISDEVVDLFLPVRFYWVRRARWLKLQAAGLLDHQRAGSVPDVSPSLS
ncbi:MAG: efflux RND transporter permease subunit [Gemmataceae bacterium]